MRSWPRLTPEDHLKGIQHCIRKLSELWIEAFGFKSADDINNGHCEAYAIVLADGFPSAQVVWDDRLHDEAGGDHCFMVYNNRYYDSETPYGVEHWSHFPMYLRNYRCCGYGYLEEFLSPSERNQCLNAWALLQEAISE